MKHTKLMMAATAVGTLLATPALATGLLAARFGGEHGHPTTDNPTAIYYNPAGLALGKGTRLFVDASLAFRWYTYNRPADAISFRLPNGPGEPRSTVGGTPEGDGVLANSGEATLNNVLASPFIGVASDFGVEGLGVGLAFYAPIGGQSKWDTKKDLPGLPGAVDGPQRWWVMEGSIRSLYFSAGGAYYIKPARLSIGVGLNMVKSEVFTVRARNADGSDDLISRTTNAQGDEYGDRLKEGRGLVDLSSWDFSLGVGLIYEPIDKMYIGLSYQSQPGFGENTLSGKATTILAQGASDVKDAEAVQAMPDVIRAGWRWRQADNEYRVFADYARWSVFKDQCIRTKGANDCGLTNVPRNWEDAFGVRAGYSRFFSQDFVEAYIGAGFDQNAIPDETLEPALFDSDKVSIALGAKLRMLDDAFRVAATWTQVIYFDRETDAWKRRPDGTLETRGTPFEKAQNPNSAGKYSQGIGVFNLNVEYAF